MTPTPDPSLKTQVSPYRVLNEMGSKRVGGAVTLHDPLDHSVGWRLYLSADHLIYATSAVGQVPRLMYLLSRLRPEVVERLSELVEGELEYEWVLQLLSSQIPLGELRQILHRVSQEALIHILAMPRASLQFNRHNPISSILLSVPWQAMANPLQKSIDRWSSLRELLPTPFSRLALDNQKVDSFCEHWETTNAIQYFSGQSISAYVRVLGQKLTIYEICAQLRCDPLTLCAWSKPLIQSEVIQVYPFLSLENTRLMVACIDDSKTVQRQVKMTLEMAGYTVMGITEPSHALTALVRQKPAVILMDVNMPEIDGYELCRMLRQSKQLKDIPVVMLTGRDGLLDRLRAQMVGVTEYLTKPFEPAQLLAALQKVSRSSPS